MDSNNMNQNDTMNSGAQYQQENMYTEPVQPTNGYADQYQQPVQPTYSYQQPQQVLEEPMSLGEWMITFLIMLIPCANIIMMFVWAFGNTEKKSKANYFKAMLIWMGILLALYLVLFLVLGVSMIGALS